MNLLHDIVFNIPPTWLTCQILQVSASLRDRRGRIYFLQACSSMSFEASGAFGCTADVILIAQALFTFPASHQCLVFLSSTSLPVSLFVFLSVFFYVFSDLTHCVSFVSPSPYSPFRYL